MKVKVTVSLGLVGCDRVFEMDVDDEDLEGMDEAARDREIWDMAFERVQSSSWFNVDAEIVE